MDNLDLIAPVIILLVTSGLVVLIDLIDRRERRGLLIGVAVLGLAASIAYTVLRLIADDTEAVAFSSTVVIDRFTLFFYVFFPAVAAFAILASADYFERMRGRVGEFIALALAIAAGAMLMAGANDLITLYVAIELTSICQYVLAGFGRDGRSSEAGLKYLLLGATSSAILLYGFALLYGLTGTTSITEIGEAAFGASGDLRFGYLAAAAALAAGFGFKMAIVPFQMWAPDVYQGAPTPVAAYLSVGSKAAGFAVALRVFYTALDADQLAQDWTGLFAVLAAASMIVGNVMAIRQTDVKRLFGYSTIAQAGYILIGLAAALADDDPFTLGASGVLFYLLAYAVTNLGAFFAIVAITDRADTAELRGFAGMWRRAPLLAIALTVCLLSLTGLPPSIGFLAKLYIFDAAVEADLIWLVIVGVLMTAVSAYYYLRIVREMFVAEPESETRLRTAPIVQAAVALAALAVIVFFVVPGPLLDAAESAARVF